MRIAFLGTPDFALASLQMLIDSGHTLQVFTQPDRPKGRHGELTPPPVKVLAQQNGIPVFQCAKIRDTAGVEALKAFAPDLMVTVAFGQILSEENLSIPRYGCINVHGSLLPKYRGAAPIQWAVINGETETGVTTMMTDVGLDTGDILMVEKTPVDPDETAGELFDRLAAMGASVLRDTIEALEKGTLTRTKQDASLASKCSMIKKEDAHLDFYLSSQRIHDFVRGMNPWPVAFSSIDGDIVKIWRTKKCVYSAPDNATPGECVIADAKSGLFVRTLDGMIEIAELQFPGGKRVDAKAALNGRNLLGKVFH
ncbi:MAG: methionyl-tRNA formyltransferase [Eubacteriales bacterium]|nr:methionyl-tRNA formyltransferase [Eubacteriales bacterium]